MGKCPPTPQIVSQALAEVEGPAYPFTMPRRRAELPRDRLVGAISAERWARPIEITLSADGERLQWDYEGNEYTRQGALARWRQEQPELLLEGFVELADPAITPRDIARFARRFGVFHDHGQPFEGEGYDEVDLWRERARRVRALLRGCAALRDGLILDAEDRAAIEHWLGWRFKPAPKPQDGRVKTPKPQDERLMDAAVIRLAK